MYDIPYLNFNKIIILIYWGDTCILETGISF